MPAAPARSNSNSPASCPTPWTASDVSIPSSIVVLEPEDQVLLTVTFDGAWEAYVRIIWQKVSRLLDLIFCNTEGLCTRLREQL